MLSEQHVLPKSITFVDERVDFSVCQQISIIAVNTWQNAIYLQIHPAQFSLKSHDASLIEPTTFCFVQPDGDLAEHTSFQEEKKTYLFIYFVLNDTSFPEKYCAHALRSSGS